MNDKKEITVSFTGHREYDNSAEEELHGAIRNLYNENYRIFLCGMARGFDLAAGEAVLSLRHELPEVQLICVIPFDGQERSFPDKDRLRFQRMTEQADDVITLAKEYRAGVYHQRNDFLVDNSSVIVAYYNGTKGGTHYTIHRALKQGLTIRNLCSYIDGGLFNDLK